MAISVGFAIFIGVIRIIKDWPIHYVISAGYLGVITLPPFAPAEIIGIVSFTDMVLGGLCDL